MSKLKRYTLPCVKEGAILEFCTTCNGEMRHVRECDVHDKCTRGIVSNQVKSCFLCAREPNTPYVPDLSQIEIERQKRQELKKQRNIETKRRMDVRREELKKRLLAKALEQRNKSSSPEEKTTVPLPSLHERRLQLRAQRKNRESNPSLQENTPVATPAIRPPIILASSHHKPILSVSSTPQENRWAVGITTVPARLTTTLTKTIHSILLSGFPEPRLFIDVQGTEVRDVEILQQYCAHYPFPMTLRSPNIKTFGNWFLALSELYIRNPHATRYALFQDDIVICQGVREYLDHCEYPEQGYLNLMTFPQNQALASHYFRGLPEEKQVGWYLSNQKGKSACGFVFNRECVLKILSNDELLRRPQDTEKGHQNIDGGLGNATKRMGYREYVHTPSLLHHTGETTTMGPNHPQHQPSDLSFKGELWDAMSIVRATHPNNPSVPNGTV